MIKANESSFFIDQNIVKIKINSATKEELSKHPYISWKLAQVIINYRFQHGPFQTVNEIKSTDLVNDELYLKIVNYIEL